MHTFIKLAIRPGDWLEEEKLNGKKRIYMYMYTYIGLHTYMHAHIHTCTCIYDDLGGDTGDRVGQQGIKVQIPLLSFLDPRLHGLSHTQPLPCWKTG